MALLMGGLGVAHSLIPTPHSNYASLMQAIRSDRGQQQYYRHETANAVFFPGMGYQLTLYVGSDKGFAPARYLTLVKLGSRLTADLMIRAGEENVSQIYGEEAASYLRRAQLDLGPTDDIYKRYYTEKRLSPPLETGLLLAPTPGAPARSSD